MTSPAPGITGPLTPYVVPGDALTGWPVGVDFSTIPMGTTVVEGQKTAALYNMCQSSTQQVDSYCNQPLRATLTTETQSGPDYYLTVQVGSGLGRMELQRWPVTQIISVQVAASGGFPRQWTTLPAGYWDIEKPAQGLYGTNAPSGAGEGGQAILIAPGYVNWWNGRNGLRVQVQYMHGWPHAGLTTAGSASTSSLVVDDCTGWGPPGTNSAANSTYGATGVIYDGASQETIQCTAASATAGPGTLSLSSPLNYTHSAGVMVSALPADVIWASALFTGADALTRGATTTVVRNISGHAGGPSGADELRIDAEMKLRPYRVHRMTLVACMNFMKDTLNGLTWPAEMQALPNPPGPLLAHITAPNPNVEASSPNAYIWFLRGTENRDGAKYGAGTIPRASYQGGPSGTKAVEHYIPIYIMWDAMQGDPNFATLFPGMVDAIRAVLRVVPDPGQPLTDPWTGEQSWVVDVGETLQYDLDLWADVNMGIEKWNVQLTCPIVEVIAG